MSGGRARGAPVPTLFLLVDAIPWEMARGLWREGLMPGFAEPRPMVSVFPSLTHVAVPALLASVFPERPQGYEARWFDTTTRELRGGFTDAESEAALRPFRVWPGGALGHAAVYLLRSVLAHGQARWVTGRFAEEGGPWLGYVSATDGVGHFDGEQSLAAALADIVREVVEARRRYAERHGVQPRVVLCSDHGMSFSRMAHLSRHELECRLVEAGWRADPAARRWVRLAPYGDVGGGVVYCDPADAVEVARTVAAAPGVEVAFGVRDADGCAVFAAVDGGMATAGIRWCGDRYRYLAGDGDPLEYEHAWRECADADGWVSQDRLREVFWHHRFPLAPPRVREGLHSIVQMPAQVLFSMRDDWTFGPALTHLGAELMGGQLATHGALSRAQSIGFATVTAGDENAWPWPPTALRPWEVLAPWRSLLRGQAD
jgi:hypothetical protein